MVYLITLASVYFFIGFLQAFAIWVARKDNPVELEEVALCIIAWPVVWAESANLSVLKTNKLLFIKVLVATASLTLLVLLLVYLLMK